MATILRAEDNFETEASFTQGQTRQDVTSLRAASTVQGTNVYTNTDSKARKITAIVSEVVINRSVSASLYIDGLLIQSFECTSDSAISIATISEIILPNETYEIVLGGNDILLSWYEIKE